MTLTRHISSEQTPYSGILSHALESLKSNEFAAAIETISPLVSTLDAANPQPEVLLAMKLLADAQKSKGLFEEAYQNYLSLGELDEQYVEQVLPSILSCLVSIETKLEDPQFESFLLTYLETEGLQSRYVEQHVSAILRNRYDLTNDEADIELSDLVVDSLLITSLKTVLFTNPEIQKLVSDLRSEVFRLAVDNGIPNVLSDIVVALAEQAHLSEYGMETTSDEQVLLLGIKTLMETHITSGQSPTELIEPLLIYLMFQSFENLGIDPAPISGALSQWPDPVKPLFQKALC